MFVFNNILNRISKLGIQFKIASVVFVAVAVALVFGFILQVSQNKTVSRANQAFSADVITDILAIQLPSPVQVFDTTQIDTIFDFALRKDADIVAIDVYLAKGDPLAQFNGNEERNIDLGKLMDGARSNVEFDGTASFQQTENFAISAAPLTTPYSTVPVGYVTIGWDMTAANQQAMQHALNALLVNAIATLLSLVMIVYMVGRMVTKPVLQLGQAMDGIADHHFETDVPFETRNDEIGSMAKRLAFFRDSLADESQLREVREAEETERQRLFERLAQGLADVADGRIDRRIDVSRFKGLDEHHIGICNDFNDVIDNLRNVLTTVTVTAENVRNSSLEIAEVVVDQSKRSEAQAVTLEESAAAIETLSASVEQTAEHAAEARERILQNRQQAQSGGEVVELTVAAMSNIEQSSQQIAAITGVIDDIAFQTNLLALNAGVEAARAGEAGRGFAVVASEVRALAQRASSSANEIKELIIRSGEQVTNGSQLVNKAGTALQEIIEGVNFASDLVSQIATGSRDQANNLLEIKEGVSELDRVTQRNVAMIEESSASSRSLSEEASRMTEALKAFRLSENDVSSAVKGWDDDLASEKTSPQVSADPIPEPARAPVKTRRAKTETIDKPKREVAVDAAPSPARKMAVNDNEDWQDF